MRTALRPPALRVPALRVPPVRPGSAAGLLVLALAGPAAAQAPAWVDPPARAAPEAPAAAPRTVDTPAAAPERSAAPAAPRPRLGAARDDEADEADAPARPRARTIRRAEPARPIPRRAPRLADTPAAGPPAADGRFPEWAGAAQALAGDYLDAVSGPGDTLAATAPRFYGSQVRFHGRTLTLPALVAEKRRFARRWPQRQYEPRSMRTACNAALATCVVRSVVAFRAASPGRGALSQGLVEVVLEVSLAGPRPVIVSESSRVLRRGAQAARSVPGAQA